MAGWGKAFEESKQLRSGPHGMLQGQQGGHGGLGSGWREGEGRGEGVEEGGRRH